MSIDSKIRDVARRTSESVAVATDPDQSFEQLVVMRRRRTGVNLVVLVSVAALAVATVVQLAGQSKHRALPAVPLPTPADTKPYLPAPPLCGPAAITAPSLEAATTVGGPCGPGSDPGRYISAIRGPGLLAPYTFNVEKGWVVGGIGTWTLDRSGVEQGATVVRSLKGTEAAVVTSAFVLPGASSPAGRSTDRSPQQMAAWLAAQPGLSGISVSATTIDGWPVSVVDLSYASGSAASDRCVVVGPCRAVMAVDTPPAELGVLGVAPGSTARAMFFGMPGTGRPGVTTMIWLNGDADASWLADFVLSLDIEPPLP